MIKSILISAIVVYLLASFIHWDITPFQELSIELRLLYVLVYLAIGSLTFIAIYYLDED